MITPGRGRLLTWEISGGGMEAGEYPQQTARSEVKEELDLDLAPDRLLAVDGVPSGSDGKPALATGTTAYLQHGITPAA